MGCGFSNLEASIWKRFQPNEVIALEKNIPCIMRNPLDVIDGDVVVLSDRVIWLRAMYTRTLEIPLKDILSVKVLARPHSEIVSDVFYSTVELSYVHKNPNATMELIFSDKKKAMLWATEIKKRIPGEVKILFGTFIQGTYREMQLDI